MDWNRAIAGIFAGVGGILLIYLDEIPAGVGILSGMMGFFVGEANGKRVASAETT